MGQIDDLNGSSLPDILRRLRALEFASNQNNMAIGRSGLRVHSGGVITIENGGLSVTGSADIIGTLNADGTINMTGVFIASGEMQLNGTTVATGNFTIEGPLLVDGDTTFNGELNITGITNITGDTTVTGVLNVNGPMKTTDTLDVEGVTTLKNDLNVTTGGKINFGDMTIDPSLFGGSIQFDGGGYLSGTASGPQMTGPSGNSFVYTRNGLAGIQATDIDLTGAVRVLGGLKITSPGTETGVTPNVYLDASGNLRKII